MQQIQFPGVDSAGNLYLSDSGSDSNAGSGFVAYFSATGQSGNQPSSFELSRLANPEGIAFDSGGNVYVAAAGEILVYPPDPTASSAPIRTLVGDFTFGEDIYGIAVDASNRLYVALSNEIEVYAAGAGGSAVPIQEFDLQSDTNAGLDSCLGIAVDSSSNIYCANFNNSTITEYAAGSTGTSVTPMVTATDATLTSIDEPFGIFVDGSGNVYVANYGNSSISVFASGSLGAGTATRRITGAATGLNFPYGLYVR
jgi:sugar lactone lactonase YvrE